MKTKITFFTATLLLTVNFMLLTLNTNAQYTKLLDFAGTTNGSTPYGDLISDGTFLYGMTQNGGSSTVCSGGCGTIFKMKLDGTGYVKLYDFDGGSNGGEPNGSLVSDGTYLYGMTRIGGTSNNGVIFKIKPDGTGYTILRKFDGVTGGSPYGSLIFDGTYLFGMTRSAGSNNFGVVFKIKPDGTGYTVMLNFDDTNNGSKPRGSLISDGTYLYGMTQQGGAYGYGVIFKIFKTSGTGSSTLLHFNGTNGKYPQGSLISDGTFLYGMTGSGGTSSNGNIFKIKPNGTGYINIHNCSSTGRGPAGSLVSDGTFLYGMMGAGGSTGSGAGITFKIKPDGTSFTNILDFTGTNGGIPNGSLIFNGTVLYGMTTGGGTNSMGTVFKLETRVCTGSPVAFTQSPTICAGQNVTVGTHIHTTNGTFKDTLIASNGCDSVVTTNLTVKPVHTFSQSFTKCSGQSVTVGTSTYTTSGTYTYVFPAAQTNGCDSTVITNLTIFSATITPSGPTTFYQGDSVTLTANSSTTYLWSNNATTQSITVYSSGSFSVTVVDANACSATFGITVTIKPPTPTISVSGTTLTSSSSTGNQWYLNGNIITGATSQSITASLNGSYTVIVTNGSGGSSTSAPYMYPPVGIVENSLASTINIYPNPTSGIINVQIGLPIAIGIEKAEIKITDILGNSVFQSNSTSSNIQIDLSSQSNGVYFISIQTNDSIVNKKIVISH